MATTRRHTTTLEPRDAPHRLRQPGSSQLVIDAGGRGARLDWYMTLVHGGIVAIAAEQGRRVTVT